MLSISKQLACQKYIFKIHSSRLRKERWKLSLSLEDARKNDEIISLADGLTSLTVSQMRIGRLVR